MQAIAKAAGLRSAPKIASTYMIILTEDRSSSLPPPFFLVEAAVEEWMLVSRGGSVVGCRVGALVGVRLGGGLRDSVGRGAGIELGNGVGALVGASTGAAVGAAVGLTERGSAATPLDTEAVFTSALARDEAWLTKSVDVSVVETEEASAAWSARPAAARSALSVKLVVQR